MCPPRLPGTVWPLLGPSRPVWRGFQGWLENGYSERRYCARACVVAPMPDAEADWESMIEEHWMRMMLNLDREPAWVEQSGQAEYWQGQLDQHREHQHLIHRRSLSATDHNVVKRH